MNSNSGVLYFRSQRRQPTNSGSPVENDKSFKKVHYNGRHPPALAIMEDIRLPLRLVCCGPLFLLVLYYRTYCCVCLGGGG